MILLRHPTPDAPKGLCYGRLDIGVSEKAPQEIAAALAATPRARRIVASPAKRVRPLAEALAERDGLDIAYDERLWEFSFGDWEGRLWPELPRAETEAWMQDMWANRAPGGDSFESFHARVAEALAEIDEETLVVCHAGPVRVARMLFLGQTFREALAEPVPYATPIDFTQEARRWRASR